MAEFSELVGALTWLLTNRLQQKIEYTHGLLGDGVGNVRVSADPDSPDVDFVFVRPDRSSNRTYKIFNKRVQGEDGDPIIIGELPWEPDLFQVVDLDWAAYKNVGWGEFAPNVTYHGKAHEWRDGAPGLDAFNVYRRQLGDLKAVSASSGTSAIDISSYSIELFGTQKQFAGITDFPLDAAIPAGTGTARMALVYWDPASGTTGALGVSTGTLGIDTDATLLNRAVSPAGTIPIAHVRLAGGMSSIAETDIFDAREPFRPGISFGTGPTQLSADKIPISDVVGFYTGSTVEAALAEVPYKLISPDGGINPVLSADIAGDVTLAGTGTFAIPLHLEHVGDPDTRWTFTDDDIEATVGGLSLLKLTEAGQDLVEIGDVAGGGDVNIKFNDDQMFLEGSDGNFGVGTTSPDAKLEVVDTAGAQLRLTFEDAVKFTGLTVDTNHDLTIDPSSAGIVKVDSFLSVNIGTQEYQLRGRAGSTALQFEAQSAGDNSIFEMFTKDGDGTDIVGIRIHGVGTTSSIANRERLEILYRGASTQDFEIRSEAQGTGTLRPILIFTEGNIDQIRLETDGNVGFGVASPQGKIHAYDTISGFTVWEFDGLDATVRTVIPNGIGDVLYRLRATYVMRDSAGAVAGATANVNNTASANLTVGTNTVRLRVNADGSTDVARTAGTDTIKIALMLNWL